MVKLDDRTPRMVSGFLDGWLKTTNSGTVANTLLAGIATGIFVHVQEKIKFTSPPVLPADSPKADALIIVAYLAILINCSAAVAAFLLADRIVATPFHVSQRDLTDEATEQHGIHKLVNFYVDWKWWRPLQYYWISSLFLGILSIFAELILYAWFIEPNLAVKVTVTTFAAFGILPLAIFLLDLAFNHLRSND